MLLHTPETIDDFLYQGRLQYDPNELNRVLPGRGPGSISAPEIGIGRPQWWDLAALKREQGQSLSPEMALLTREADFFLVHLACSFRPTRSSWVESASFIVYLRPRSGDGEPIAYDIYPRDVQEESTKDIKVAISPSLKFTDTLEAGLGSVEMAFQLTKIEPVITAFGLLEARPGWDFMRTREQDIRGAKFLYLVLKRPKGVDAVRATFELSAQVRLRQGLLKASASEVAAENLSVVICD